MQKTYEDHRNPFRNGLFRLSGVMAGLHQPVSITLVGNLCAGVEETDRSVFSVQVKMHVILMYSICDGRQNAQRNTESLVYKNSTHRLPKGFLPLHEKNLCLLRRFDALPHNIPPGFFGYKSLEPLKVAQ